MLQLIRQQTFLKLLLIPFSDISKLITYLIFLVVIELFYCQKYAPELTCMI